MRGKYFNIDLILLEVLRECSQHACYRREKIGKIYEPNSINNALWTCIRLSLRISIIVPWIFFNQCQKRTRGLSRILSDLIVINSRIKRFFYTMNRVLRCFIIKSCLCKIRVIIISMFSTSVNKSNSLI